MGNATNRALNARTFAGSKFRGASSFAPWASCMQNDAARAHVAEGIPNDFIHVAWWYGSNIEQ